MSAAFDSIVKGHTLKNFRDLRCARPIPFMSMMLTIVSDAEQTKIRKQVQTNNQKRESEDER